MKRKKCSTAILLPSIAHYLAVNSTNQDTVNEVLQFRWHFTQLNSRLLLKRRHKGESPYLICHENTDPFLSEVKSKANQKENYYNFSSVSEPGVSLFKLQSVKTFSCIPHVKKAGS